MAFFDTASHTVSDVSQMWSDAMEQSDKRLLKYPLMSSPLPTVIILLIYFLAIFVGNRIMKKRKPFELRSTMIIYNFMMVAISFFIVIEFLLSGWLVGYSLGCELVDFSNDPQALRMVRVCYLFYFSKLIELLDTMFFVLRKKTSHISFLHVVHHAIMPISLWIGIKYTSGGLGTFFALLNSIIHTMMYTYYGFAAMGPSYQKYIWWKKHMTKAQMLQFAIVTIHSANILFFTPNCNYSRPFTYVILAYAVFFLILFTNFYIQAYRRGQRHSRKEEKNNPSAAVAAKNLEEHEEEETIAAKDGVVVSDKSSYNNNNNLHHRVSSSSQREKGKMAQQTNDNGSSLGDPLVPGAVDKVSGGFL